ncbi:FAR1-related sequence 5-like protein isoform X1 [Tanacetum coccineum]
MVKRNTFGYAPNTFEDVTVQETPKGTPQSGSRIHQTTLGYAPNGSDEVDSPCQTQKGTPQSGSMARPTTLAYARNNTKNEDEPIHQNPMGIPESGSMARRTTLGYAPNGYEDEHDSFQETLKGYASSSSDDDMVETTPNGSKFWIPEAKNKPLLGTTFDSVEEAFQFYKAYAIEAGFEVKRGGAWNPKKQLNPKLKFFYCVREGFKPAAKKEQTLNDHSSNDQSSNDQTTDDQAIPDGKMIERRKRASCRCGCNAQIRIKRIAGSKYMVYKFVEKHNHCLVHEDDIKYLRTCRKLTYPKQLLLHQLSNVNLGPVRSFKVMKEMYGGFENIGATSVECKNFRRGLNHFIGNRDAHMVVQKLLARAEFCPGFSVEYLQDENDKSLVGLFWADETAKRNYAAFGDVVSFDATFRSNRLSTYSFFMKSFTYITTYKVNLLVESPKNPLAAYEIFKKVFGNAPKVVVTDQDPAMRLAIVEIFPDTRHRLCMWHIMQKLTNKVGTTICSNTDFKRRLCNIVWTDKIEPETFDKKWAAILDEFSLNENKWLSDMFEMRDRWIPAYFRNEPMSGLMRTTSRSESENHFFGQITSTRLSLVEFVSHYDTAMDSQRFIYGKNNHDSMYTTPDLKTDLLVEKEAAELYTRTLFYDVQEEIYSSLMNCYALNVHEGESHRHFVIRDTGADFEYKGVVVEVKYEVNYVPSEGKINCSCLRYECYGLLCRHIFYVLRLSKVHNFPKSYLQKRWSKNAMPHKSVGRTVEVGSSSNAVNDSDSLIRDIYGKVEESVNRLVGDFDRLQLYRDAQDALLKKAKSDIPNPPS